jgi:hypothetical protein
MVIPISTERPIFSAWSSRKSFCPSPGRPMRAPLDLFCRSGAKSGSDRLGLGTQAIRHQTQKVARPVGAKIGQRRTDRGRSRGFGAKPRQDLGQVIRVKRYWRDPVPVGGMASRNVPRLDMRGHADDRRRCDTRRQGAEPAGRLDPRRARQVHVHQDGIEGPGPPQLRRRLARVGDHRAMTKGLEAILHDFRFTG